MSLEMEPGYNDLDNGEYLFGVRYPDGYVGEQQYGGLKTLATTLATSRSLEQERPGAFAGAEAVVFEAAVGEYEPMLAPRGEWVPIEDVLAGNELTWWREALAYVGH